MSTRIHNGFRLMGHSFESYLRYVPEIRERLQEKAQSLARQFVMNYAVMLYDLHQLGIGTHEKPRSYLGAGFDAYMARHDNIERDHSSDPLMDFTAEVVLFPGNGYLLGVMFIANKELREIWQSQPAWEEFAYWDNSDEPEDISPADWEKRKRLWEEAMPDYRPPSQYGYSLNLLRNFDSQHPMTNELFVPHLLSFEDRVQMAANRLLVVPGLTLAPELSREETHAATAEFIRTRLVENLTIDMLRGRI